MTALTSFCAAVACLVAGDSLGVGISQAARVPSAAISGIGTGHPSIEAAVRRAPRGAVVLVSVGTNDVRDISAPLARLRAAAEEAGVRLVVLSPPRHVPASLDRRTRLRAAEIAASGLEVIDLSAVPAERAGDGIHFTGRGYRALAEHIGNTLR